MSTKEILHAIRLGCDYLHPEREPQKAMRYGEDQGVYAARSYQNISCDPKSGPMGEFTVSSNKVCLHEMAGTPLLNPWIDNGCYGYRRTGCVGFDGSW